MIEFDALADLFAPDVPALFDSERAAALSRRIRAIEARADVRDEHAHPSTEGEFPVTSKVIPYLTVTDARAAIDFYREVFGFDVKDGELFEMDDGRIGHATLELDDVAIYLSDEYPEMEVVAPATVGGSTMAIVITVPDADATFRHAIDAGARAQRPVGPGHGGRSGWFFDPWGHRWSPFTADPV